LNPFVVVKTDETLIHKCTVNDANQLTLGETTGFWVVGGGLLGETTELAFTTHRGLGLGFGCPLVAAAA